MADWELVVRVVNGVVVAWCGWVFWRARKARKEQQAARAKLLATLERLRKGGDDAPRS